MASRVEDLDVDGVVSLLVHWEMKEFVDLVEKKQINGRKLLEVTEGIVKLWQPKSNAKKFTEFIAEVKLQPDKYLNYANKDAETEVITKTDFTIHKTDANIEAQYQTVSVKRVKDQLTSSIRVEEIINKIVPAKSFLYRNNAKVALDKPVSSYVPMDAGTQKKPKRFFRLSSYEYPNFDIKHFRLSKTENFNDRGYYQVKTNSMYLQKSSKTFDNRTKIKTEDIEKFPEEHFYEDLNYIDKEESETKEVETPKDNVKHRMVKIQELFSTFKLPFFKKSEEAEVVKRLDDEKRHEDVKTNECECDKHIYENSDSVASVYDFISVNSEENKHKRNGAKLQVEEYLEPVQVNKDYCDVAIRPRDDSILSYILNIFENLGMRKETTEDPAPSDPGLKTPEKPVEVKPRSSMADRPLPVPVENEPYFMNIDRTEAENLLMGQPDGTFILRPSSQPDHAYTLTVSCSGAVHNVGIRRRQDGRLALGFARRAERSFENVTSLLRHHRKQRLLLVAGGTVCGATALTNSPEYYQTPSELARPVKQAV